MALSLFKKNSSAPHARTPRHRDIDARRWWVIVLCSFVSVLIIELLYFSWLFWSTNRRIDAPATPTEETNAGAIRAIERTLTTVESAIESRTGTSLTLDR